MKMSNVIKKISAIVMVFAMLLSVFGMSGSGITAKASASPVKLYSCQKDTDYRGYEAYSIYIQIDASSAANKAVYVHYDAGESGWLDQAASYVGKLDNNTEIWEASIEGRELGSNFAVKYVGDGQAFWDNNNGSNYTFGDVLGVANVKVKRADSQFLSYYGIRAIIKNLDYTKVVKVRYTVDNWATYQDVELNYLLSNTVNNTEIWGVTLNIDPDKGESFQYCVSYEVNGQIYWDNNFGQNYDINYYSPY